MINNYAGNMIDKWLQKIPEKFHNIILDEYIIMPDHLHAIIINTGSGGSIGSDISGNSNGPVGADPCVCPINQKPIDPPQSIDPSQPNVLHPNDSNELIDPSQSKILYPNDSNESIDIPPFFGVEGEHKGSPLHRVIQWVKTMSTNEYIRNVKSNGWQPFDRKLWQRNYHEHIIRDNESYQRIKQYIIENPMKWDKKPGAN